MPQSSAATDAVAATADTGAGAPTILDDTLLSDLDRRLGKDKMRMFAGLFDERLSQAMAIVRDATDHQRRALEAHSLISLAGNLGCTELMGWSRAVSLALRQGRDDIAILLTELSGAANRAALALAERYAP